MARRCVVPGRRPRPRAVGFHDTRVERDRRPRRVRGPPVPSRARPVLRRAEAVRAALRCDRGRHAAQLRRPHLLLPPRGRQRGRRRPCCARAGHPDLGARGRGAAPINAVVTHRIGRRVAPAVDPLGVPAALGPTRAIPVPRSAHGHAHRDQDRARKHPVLAALPYGARAAVADRGRARFGIISGGHASTVVAPHRRRPIAGNGAGR